MDIVQLLIVGICISAIVLLIAAHFASTSTGFGMLSAALLMGCAYRAASMDELILAGVFITLALVALTLSVMGAKASRVT